MQLARQHSRWLIVGSLILVVLLVLGACAKATPTPAPAATPVAPKAAATPAAPEAPKAAAPAATPTPAPAAPAKKVAPVIGIEIDTSHPMSDDYGPLKIEMPRFLTFSGTSAPASPYTFMVNPVIQNIEKAFPRLTVRHLPGGTRPNVERVGRGEAQIAVTTSGEAAMATVPYKAEYPTAQKVMLLSARPFPTVSIGVTLPGSGFETFKDWATKPGFRMGAQYTGSATTRFAIPSILATYNASYDTIKAKGGSIYYATGDWKADLFDKLFAKQVDAIQWSGGIPDTYLKSQELIKDIVVIGLTDEEMKVALKLYPGTGPNVIPKGTYKSNKDKDLMGLGYVYAYIVSSDISEGVAYNLLWAIYQDNGKALAEAYAGLGAYDHLRWQEGVPQVAPYHPGALKYFQARGVKIPPPAEPPADWLK